MPAQPITNATVLMPAPGWRTDSQPSTVSEPASTRRGTFAAVRVEQAEQAMNAVDAGAPGTVVGVEVFDRDSQSVVARIAADRQFHSASVVKLLIAIDAMREEPVPDVARQVHQMLVTSDDSVANALWNAGGGTAIVARMSDLLGLSATQPPRDPTEWGYTMITAADVVTVYRYITDRLPQSQRDLIEDALADASQQAADGVDQYFGIPDGIPDAPWAVKQGWMVSEVEVVLHTTGLVGRNSRYVTVLLTSAPADTPWSKATQAITAGAAALTPRRAPAPDR
ncbi:serine hydrolase [Saccharopolyspora shandongensis]|uniref:serine hydrolase n=1 Tax=Saccharopolyspora shandongensis TaxID=418495 RepID=UPI0033E83096